jgi:hypothetical protein
VEVRLGELNGTAKAGRRSASASASRARPRAGFKPWSSIAASRPESKPTTVPRRSSSTSNGGGTLLTETTVTTPMISRSPARSAATLAGGHPAALTPIRAAQTSRAPRLPPRRYLIRGRRPRYLPTEHTSPTERVKDQRGFAHKAPLRQADQRLRGSRHAPASRPEAGMKATPQPRTQSGSSRTGSAREQSLGAGAVGP